MRSVRVRMRPESYPTSLSPSGGPFFVSSKTGGRAATIRRLGNAWSGRTARDPLRAKAGRSAMGARRVVALRAVARTADRPELTRPGGGERRRPGLKKAGGPNRDHGPRLPGLGLDRGPARRFRGYAGRRRGGFGGGLAGVLGVGCAGRAVRCTPRAGSLQV